MIGHMMRSKRTGRSRTGFAGMLLALAGGLVAAAPFPAEAFVDFADFVWTSPNSDPDGDLKYDVSGTTPIQIDVTAKLAYRFDRVRVTLSTQPPDGPAVSHTICETVYQGILPTDFPTSIAVNVQWEAGTVPGASVPCSGGNAATNGGAMVAGTHYMGVTVWEATDAATVTEGQSRMLELPSGNGGGDDDDDDQGCQSNCGPGDDDDDDDDADCLSNCDGGNSGGDGNGGGSIGGGGSGSSGSGGGNGNSKQPSGGSPESGGSKDGEAEVSPETASRSEGSAGDESAAGGEAARDGAAGSGDHDVSEATLADVGLARRMTEVPMVALVGFGMSGLLVFVGLGLFLWGNWQLFLIARRRRRKDDDEEQEDVVPASLPAPFTA